MAELAYCSKRNLRMKYLPSQTKYKKYFTYKKKNHYAAAQATIARGMYGLQLQENAFLTPAQLEAVRRVIVRYTQRKVKIWFRQKPTIPVSKKPNEVRMGKGKGKLVKVWGVPAVRGTVFCEIRNYSAYELYPILKKCLKKMPYKCLIRLNRAYSSIG